MVGDECHGLRRLPSSAGGHHSYAVATSENQRAELQALIPGTQIVIVIDHNYSE